MKQKMARYEMHKYWGKKPSKDLSELIDKYSQEGDVVFDPFAGYGVFVCEAYLKGRNAIGNDLNPVSTFIQNQLLSADVEINDLEQEAKRILNDSQKYIDQFYSVYCPFCGDSARVLATLRSKQNIPIKNKIKCKCSHKAIEYQIGAEDLKLFIRKEKSVQIGDHPCVNIIRNGRINAIEGMTTDDLFTKRSLFCHIALKRSIETTKNKKIRDLLKLAFSSNLANCSRLVPPIKTRGEMAPGAWMTGFYTGETYIENNVFHYFSNRVSKVIAGKKEYLEELRKKNNIQDKGKVKSFDSFDRESRAYLILNGDAKHLKLEDESIDYIFTDPPYGDSVPYFEQSVIWNTWLDLQPDYTHEVVVSDSKPRKKDSKTFARDISECIKEIYRVLKYGKFFSITYHSISGEEWYALTKACLESGFLIQEVTWLTQKTFAPRQLNRKKTIKGDVLITFVKTAHKIKLQRLNKTETESIILTEVAKKLTETKLSTGEIFIIILNRLFSSHILFEESNFIEILAREFELDSNGYWNVK